MNIVIVGLGVIGGSFAKSLHRLGGHTVYGVDRDPETLRKATQAGLIGAGSTDAGEFLPLADLTVLCIYPDAVRPFLEQYGGLVRAGSVITDTAGVKQQILRSAGELFPPQADFILGHPMAGREKRGFDFASAEVFDGANYILTPLEQNRPENLDMVERLVLEMGFGRVMRISPAEHDQLIAFTSQLPHALAVALINSDEEGRDTGCFIGDSYRDLTRIANINENLWSELFLINRENLLESIENFEAQLDIIKEALRCGDSARLQERFRTSSARRQKLNVGDNVRKK